MAPITCPECHREINTCPHCGHSLELGCESSGPQESEITTTSRMAMTALQRRRIIVGVVLIAVIGSLGLSLLARQRARSEYIENLNLLCITMLVGASEAEALCNLIAQVWRDTIYEEYNAATAKFTIKEYYYSPNTTSYSKYAFEDDFNVSLAKLFRDGDTISRVDVIKENREAVDSIMKNLKNPSPEFERCYATVQELYGAYQGLTSLAIDPVGSLQTFSQSKNDKAAKFLECLRLLETQIPDK
jgi:hypothetical protein